MLTFPVEMYVCRHVLDASIFQTVLGMGPITSLRHYTITLGLWLLSVILALSTRDLGDIMEIFGAFGASVSNRTFRDDVKQAISWTFSLVLLELDTCFTTQDCLSSRLHPSLRKESFSQPIPFGLLAHLVSMFTEQTIGYVMPAMLHIQTNRGELRRCMAAWRRGTPEYERHLMGRLWAIRKFALPFFMVLFGLVAMIAGVATAIISELHPTKT